MKVRLSQRTQRAIERVDARWQGSADYRDVFRRELLESTTFLETVSTPGTPCPTSRRPSLKRTLLQKSKCHLYFQVNEREQAIEVLTVWDGRREKPPKL